MTDKQKILLWFLIVGSLAALAIVILTIKVRYFNECKAVCVSHGFEKGDWAGFLKSDICVCFTEVPRE